MWGDQAWLPLGVPVLVLDGVEITKRGKKPFLLGAGFRARRYCHAETGGKEAFPQTVDTKLEVTPLSKVAPEKSQQSKISAQL